MGIQSGLWHATRGAFVMCLLAAVPARAVITFNDSSPNYVPAPSMFDGVGLLNNGAVYCSAALLADGAHALTAAHCVAGSPANQVSLRFQLAGGPVSYGVNSYALSPDYSLNGLGFPRAGDIAVLTLDATADPSLHRYAIYTGSGEFGQQVTLAGMGYAGSGTTGDSGGLGALRVGDNVYDIDPFFLIGGSLVNFGAFLAYDFDNGNAAQNITGDLGLGAAEGFTGAGDSGGPSFLSVNGNLVITGVHSWRGRLVNGGGTSQDIDGSINGTFGELAADTRVSTYSTWVNDVANVPEPATNGLMALALSAIVLAARRRG